MKHVVTKGCSLKIDDGGVAAGSSGIPEQEWQISFLEFPKFEPKTSNFLRGFGN